MDDLSIINDKLKYKEISSEKLIKFYLKQISEKDAALNAVVHVGENILENAQKADQRSNSDSRISKIDGIPFLVKDTLKVQNMITTSGSKQFSNFIPSENSGLVQRLTDSGAVVIGKTNTPKFGFDVQTDNELFGRTNNPWNLDYTPGGSSGGSAAAVASGMIPFAVGSDLTGSLRIPASFCGIVSYKPSGVFNLTTGHIPPEEVEGYNSYSLAVGLMARRTSDIEFIFHSIFNPDSKVDHRISDTSVKLTPSISGIETDQRIVKSVENLAFKLNPQQTKFEFLDLDYNVEDVSQLHKKLHEYVNPGILEGRENQNLEIKELIRRREEKILKINEIVSKNNFLILPVSPCMPFKHNPKKNPIVINDKKINYWKATLPYVTIFSITGHPVVTLPIGVVDGFPVGVQVVGPINEDEALLRIVSRIEESIGLFYPNLQ